jgi:hypothetical protein
MADVTESRLSGGKEEFHMRRTVQLALLSGLILGLAAALGSAGSAQGAYAREGCSNHSLRGAYGFAYEAQFSEPPEADVAAEGRVVFDGGGSLAGRETESFKGVITDDIPFTGHYTIDPDCTGLATITGGNQTANFKLMLVEGGQEVNVFVTDPGVVAVGQITKEQLGHCTAASLKGTYSFASEGSFYASPGGAEFADAAVFARFQFDGQGHNTETASTSFNGAQQSDILETGTYVVNSDCTGTAVATHPDGGQDRVNFVLVERATEIKFIVTSVTGSNGQPLGFPVFAGSVDKAATGED